MVVGTEISPISMQADYRFPKQFVSEEGADTKFEKEPPQLMGVRLKDGTVYSKLSLGLGSAGYVSEESDLYRISFAVDRILDVNQVEALLFLKNTSKDRQTLNENDYYIVPLS